MKALSNESRLILVVDDEEATRYALAWALKNAGFKVIEANSGLSGLDMLTFEPDLVVLDVMLPDISGFEVCRRIKDDERSRSIPVLQMSACYTTSLHKTQGLELGADGYLVHPVEPAELLATVRALLRIRESETAARNAADLWSATFDALQDSVCLVDGAGIIVRHNRAFPSVFPNLTEGDELFTNLPDARFGSEDMKFGNRWYSVSMNPLPNGGDVCTFKDITDRREAEQGHLEAKRIAEEASQSKSLFLANMSHEIRTPLGIMLGYANLLNDSSLPSAERHHFVDTVIRNGESLASLINDILDVSKIEAGKMSFEVIPVDIHALLVEVIESMRFSALQKSIELNLEWSQDIPKQILTDRTRLRQILVNVMGNALKFTDSGRVVVRVQALANDRIVFDIEDTGCGISLENQKKLFVAFSQADESTTRKFGGTGLGLALSQKLARGLRGDIELVESRLNEGSVYRITLPRVIPMIDSRRQGASIEQPVMLENVRILVADDSPDNRFLLNRILTRKGAVVQLVENGAEAVEQAEGYDLIIMDIQMPVMDGYQAIKTLRFNQYAGPIIALTAHAMQEEKDRVKAIGCDDYLTKPIDTKALLSSISRNLNREEKL